MCFSSATAQMRETDIALASGRLREQKVNCQESQELITGLVDDELSSAESALIVAHLRECSSCAESFARESALKRLVRDAATAMGAPTELRARVASTRSPKRAMAWATRSRRSAPRARSLAAHAAGLVILMAIPLLASLYWLASPQAPLTAGIFENYRQVTEGEVTPVKMANLRQLKEVLMLRVDGQFAPMAYDFSAMQIHLIGGLHQQIAQRNVLLAVYQGTGLTIICYTFVASNGDLPNSGEIYFDADKKLKFYQFSHAGVHAVMHREGDINCILMSQMPMADLLRLARAKAKSA